MERENDVRLQNRLAPGLLFALALTTLLLLFWWLDDGPSVELTRPIGDGRSEAPLPLTGEASGKQTAPPERVAVEFAKPPDEKKKTRALAIVRGRCIAAENAAPLPGCTVTFEGRPGNSAAMARYGKVEWQAPKPVVTGADGRFEIVFVAMPPYQHSLGIEAEGRVPRTGRWGSFEPGQVEDLGDVRVHNGYAVSGWVVDTSGNPVAKVSVGLSGLPLPIRADMGANSDRYGSSDDAGRFQVRVPIPAGTWSLGVYTRGLKLVRPDAVTVRAGSGAEPLEVVVKRMPSISGVAVDEQGLPAARIGLTAVLNRSGRMAHAWVAKDGTFRIYAVDDDLKPVRLETSNPRGFEPLRDDRHHEWGTKDLRIVLKRALSFELTVVEAGSGAPVEDYAVTCHATEARSSLQRDLRLGGHHPAGRVTVDQVWRGKNQLVVHPKSGEFAISETIVFTAEDGGIPSMRVEVARLRAQAVRVVTRAGEPVPGSTVELIRKGTREFEADSFAVTRNVGMRFRGRLAELLSKAVTDAAGAALLYAPAAETGDLILRARGDAHLTLLRRGVKLDPGGEPLELVVSKGGGIAGRVALAGFANVRVRIEMRRTDQRSIVRRGGGVLRVSADGNFRAEGLEAGEYQVFLGVQNRYRREGISFGGTIFASPALARVEILDGEIAEVELDAAPHRPASVRGLIFVDGAPLADGRVFVAGVSGTTGRYGQYVPDSSGGFEAKGLLPGRYRVGIVLGDFKTGEGTSLLGDTVIVLAAGQQLDRKFHFVLRRLKIRLLTSNGEKPVAGQRCLLESGRFRVTETTDADGWIVVDPAPAGKFKLHVVRDRKYIPLEPFTVPKDKKESVVELRMKPAR